ncbi:glycoside hydrolase family 3 C-terminal domain-containing protein [Microlunatus sp. Gsoil 973]|uniref:glycoside hydrolase family 3 C-terminal domain-containing protein n=1 Tax=Microlunatus sp. Gsoil 973 TaxID=2672569 RepID=UPI0012B47791|nr:glycoside hydrolase family 3 C-terminal domain-containing protein [Microlunatus sp. Gsoil 973]QGN34612.1 beta-glucosidase [Microlunatus sp. Gsoil 973]
MTADTERPVGQDQDVEAVLGQLTLEEKAALSIGGDIWHTAAVERLGIEPIMVSDGPHGLRAQFQTGDHVGLGDSVPATCYPTASALASSWNPDLVRRVGAAIGREALRWQVSVVLGPGVNMKRSPLCGRNFEYLSEDPWLAGELATAMVQGIQSQGVGASLKHFAVNNQETDRMRVSAEVDQRTLREIYLPAFERVIKVAEPWTVMCSYNKINRTYASQHHWLLTEVLREEWGYDGLVMSDWGAVHDRPAAVAAGLDLEMPPLIGHSDVAVVRAVRDGTLPESTLDETVRRVLRLVARSRPARQAEHAFDEDDHHRIAREAARQSAVLLKNSDGLLPVGSPGQRILVIGEFAREPRFQGAGSSQVNPTRIDIPLDELATLAGPDVTVDFVPGYSLEDAASDEGLRAEALTAAREADAVLAFLGLPASAESEGFDRTRLDLPDNQLALLDALQDHRDKVAVILANGSAVRTSTWQHQVSAILECWLSGQAAGGAVAELLLGRANPSGKLAETIPIRLQDNSSYLNFPGGDGIVRYGEGIFIGYRGYDRSEQEVSFPFGHGLSYTSFQISEPSAVVQGSVESGDLIVTITATVTNTGRRGGAEVVQAYVGDPLSIVPRPVRELKAFARVELQPGESADVAMTLDERAFAFWSERLNRWAVEAGEFVISVGSSSRDLAGSTSIMIDAPSVTGPIHRDSTMAEWLADPAAAAMLTADPRIDGALQAMDEPMRAMFGDMPASTVAGFGFLGFDLGALDDMISKLNNDVKETDV